MEKLHIVKIGGKVIDQPAVLEQFLSDFAGISDKKILVHGGGKVATDIANKLGIPQKMLNGRRITDAETLKVVTMVYAGLVNKQIVALLQKQGCNAVGLSGADCNSIRAVKRTHPEIDYGFAGDILAGGINASLIARLVDEDIVPVFCPLTHDGKGQLLNTNADTIASSIAVALSEKFETILHFCFEKKGVLRDAENEETLIGELSEAAYHTLKASGIISDGMIPKLDNAFQAMKQGVHRITIGRADNLAAIIEEKENAGTRLVI
ncbi:MAG: acetylglutamate kinase [Chitinophagales bacterium]|nr:MAG: acetylglutamate kinase [Chitinophagales bacterium]